MKRRSQAARFFLIGIALAVLWSPRIGSLDLRVQDLLLGPAFVVLLVSGLMPKMKPVWGRTGWTFIVLSTVTVTVHALSYPAMSDIRILAFWGRTIEFFVLSSVVAGCYVAAGRSAATTLRKALVVGVTVNTVWVVYQHVTDASRTLIGPDTVAAYGPQLVGEGSPFGSGMFFVFVAALAGAAIRAQYNTQLAWAGIATSILGAYLVNSRVSLVAATVVTLIVATQSNGRARGPLLRGAIVAGATASIATAWWAMTPYFSRVVPVLAQSQRLSVEGLESGVSVRVNMIWHPLVDIAMENAILGIGPGALGTEGYPWTEAHNIALRAILDYGWLGGIAFLAVFARIAWSAKRELQRAESGDEPLVFYANLVLLMLVGILIGGTVQDALTAVTSTHLLMLAVGGLAGEITVTRRFKGKKRSFADRSKPLDCRSHRLEYRTRALL